MCPTCRHLAVIDDHTDTHNHHASSASTSPIVKGLIDNMDVRCRHQLDHEESLAEQLQRGGKEKCGSGSSSSNNDDTTTVTATADSLQVKYAQVTNCNWTGKLSEYPSHLESNSCPLQKIHCLGCNSLHMRGYLKSGYCHNSECVVLAARSVLEKKDRMDANEVLSKCVVLEARSVLEKKQIMDEKESKMGVNSPPKLKIEINGNEDKENRCGNEDSLLLRSASKLKAMTPTNHHRQEHNQQQQSQQQPPKTPLATRVYIQADVPQLSAITSSFSTCKDTGGSKDESCLIPTSWGLIQDPTVNSVRFVSQMDNHAVLDEDLNCPSKSTNDSNKTKKSNKIIVVPNNNNNNQSKYSDAFLLAVVKVQVAKELAKQQLQSRNSTPTAVKSMLVHQYIIDFCSRWIRRKPQALFDFVVYRPSSNVVSSQEGGSIKMNKLLCGIPGPKRTEWECGLYPVLLEWTDRDLPPICKFPKHFHHANVCPTSGIVMLSTFSRVEEWHPEISIPEILFDLQQLLAHPNHHDEVLSEEEEANYQFKIRIQNSMYGPNSILGTAQDIDGFGESRLWQLVDGDALLCRGGRKDNINVDHVRPKEPEFNGSSALLHNQREVCKARCSCCAYGQSLWDEKHEMRFIFGTGMCSLP